jgi:ribosome biogenesis GTPase A
MVRAEIVRVVIVPGRKVVETIAVAEIAGKAGTGAMVAGVARSDGITGGPLAPLPPAIDAETWLAAAAERHTSGDTARMAQRLLDDFRRGVLGAIALELPG